MLIEMIYDCMRKMSLRPVNHTIDIYAVYKTSLIFFFTEDEEKGGQKG